MIALITIFLVAALIFVLLRIIGHSEEHVNTVRKTKVLYKESLRWRPDAATSEKRIREDFVDAQKKKKADYGDFNLSKKSFKLIGKLSNVEDLVLTRATFDEEWLSYITKLPLKELVLEGTPLSDKGIPYILKLKKLKSLSIGDTEVTDEGLRLLSSSRTLKDINITLGRCITNDGIKYLGEMKQLKMISFPNSKALTGDCFPYLSNLRKLIHINAKGIPSTPENISALENLPRLWMLVLADCNLKDAHIEELSKCSSLGVLNISGSDITDKSLPYLAKLTSLRRLALKDCPKLSEEGVNELQAKLPGCTITFSPYNSFVEKLRKRNKAKDEIEFLESEARSELEKLNSKSK